MSESRFGTHYRDSDDEMPGGDAYRAGGERQPMAMLASSARCSLVLPRETERESRRL